MNKQVMELSEISTFDAEGFIQSAMKGYTGISPENCESGNLQAMMDDFSDDDIACLFLHCEDGDVAEAHLELAYKAINGDWSRTKPELYELIASVYELDNDKIVKASEQWFKDMKTEEDAA